jgi:methylmalonyl-CoA/ethylmalonyl-CoA epimerase
VSDLRLDHIAVAVPNLEEALRFYRDQLGLTCLETEVVEEQGVRVAKLDLGNTHLELLEPLSPDSPVGKFLKHRGPGLHHICLGTQNILPQMDKLKESGSCLIDEQPRLGASGARIAFVHPKSTGGVLLELSEPAKPSLDHVSD